MYEESKDEDEKDIRVIEVLELAKNFKTSTYTGDFKCPDASSYGGFQLLDAELTSRLRSAGKELLVMAGKKILNG